MSTIIKFDLKELKQLANDKNSCVIEKPFTQTLSLEPWCLGNLKETIKKTLDFNIGKYVKELNGILLSYKNLRILQNIGTIKSDNADVNFQIQADYFIFQPYLGATLKGIVTKKSFTHLSVLVHRVFNVVIPRPTEDRRNTWIGLNIKENQYVEFKVAALDLFGALPYIRGELNDRWTELGYGGDDLEHELSHTKINDESHQQQRCDKPVSSARNFIGPIKHSTQNNTTVENNSICQRHIAAENDVNPQHTKSKNKRHK